MARSRRDCRDPEGRIRHGAPSPSPELIAVAPRGELRPKRLTDANQLQAFGDFREADVVGRHAQMRSAEETLTVFDCFPPLFDGREVPTLAPPAHDPEPAARRVERQPASHGEMLDGFVLAERRLTEDARRVHSVRPPYLYTTRSRATPGGARTPNTRSPASPPLCLLYTSDAA